MKIIELKIDEEPHQDIDSGHKTCEVREMRDRDFEVGDILHLRRTLYTGEDMHNSLDTHPLIYTGHETYVRVTHILEGPIYGIPAGLCVMSIQIVPEFLGKIIKLALDNKGE